MTDIHLMVDYLFSQSYQSMFALFWFFVLFDVPRNLLLFLPIAFLKPRAQMETGPDNQRVAMVISGHSEADSIESCVIALHEQSRPPDEIIVVSDGSEDRMSKVMASLLHRGLVDQAHATDLRCGKSAGTNLAARFTDADIIINVDCDCSFDRHAIRNILRPFRDPRVAAVCGTIIPRNARRSLITAFQMIEYMVSISLGRQSGDRIGQVVCVSGAFGAFRRKLYQDIGGLDAGGGEDLDLTTRLRKAGWRIRFAADAVCYTDVPDTLRSFVRQRFRWERDAIRLRYRKHGSMMNPFSSNFRSSELFSEIEFLFLNVISSVTMPFYLGWLFMTYGSFGVVVLMTAQLVLWTIDIMVFFLAASVTPAARGASMIPYVVGYSVFSGFFMRFIRLAAYVQEWVFKASYSDAYVPTKVHAVRG